MFDLLCFIYVLSGCEEYMRSLPLLNSVVGTLSPELALEASNIMGFSNTGTSGTKKSYSVGQKYYLRFMKFYNL